MKHTQHMHADQLLLKHGITPTATRVVILDTLIRTHDAISIDSIQKQVGNGANYVTLYRVLKLLVSKGIIYQTDFRDGKAYYEYQGATQHHHHIVCTECGRREVVSHCGVSGITIPRTSIFSEITSHALEYFGICKKCTSQ